MKVFVITIILVGLCVFGLCFNIIFKKDGKFPDGEIAHNKELKKRGIVCASAEEKILWSKKGNKNRKSSSSCSGAAGEENPCHSCMSDCSKAGR